MPYIKQRERELFVGVETLCVPLNAGELNYVITRLIHRYVACNGHRYQQMNDVVGALESAKHEFQRRIVNPYEDQKIAENGDIT